ncbi:Kinesin- protein 6 [Phlyctochytrium bullatum]|nr:Kinesin- protein 6 [Phlyctochytrium bullatum]
MGAVWISSSFAVAIEASELAVWLGQVGEDVVLQPISERAAKEQDSLKANAESPLMKAETDLWKEELALVHYWEEEARALSFIPAAALEAYANNKANSASSRQWDWGNISFSFDIALHSRVYQKFKIVSSGATNFRAQTMGGGQDESGSPTESRPSTPNTNASPHGLTSSNIRIFVRMRPPRQNSKLHITPGRYYCSNPETTTTSTTDPDSCAKIGFHTPKDENQGIINNQRETYDYRFNRVFDEKTTQEEVFDYVAKDVVVNVMDGYNGTIFAYGQTGSGKTFTITGGAERYSDRGLIPRTLQFIFKEAQKRQGYHFDVAISYLEIYNENGYDLLDSTRDAKKLEDLPSERTSRTGINGKLFQEASYINLSLHYLEQVIVALYEKGQGKRTHIPYRNSMMTSVLRDSLGGNCMTTMIATVAPEDELIDESISTCRFAQRVALISNAAHVNEEVDPKLLIAKLRREIARLKAELAIARGEKGEEGGELPEYERERIRQAVDDYIADRSADAALIFSDYRKIHEAFAIMKRYILEARSSGGDKGMTQRPPAQPVQNITKASVSPPATGVTSDELQKLRALLANRDNEINVLISMINQYKSQGEKNPDFKAGLVSNTMLSRTSTLHSSPKLELEANNAVGSSAALKKAASSSIDLSASIPQFTTEKAKAFEIFKAEYPSGSWIDSQRALLKTKYAEAKALGEEANKLRTTIS